MQNQGLSYPELMTAGKGAGFIYIMTNPSYPGCIKIGKTTRLPGGRASELSSGTAVPTPFSVAYCRFVENLTETESKIHKDLWEFRTNDDREFFNLDPAEAQKKVDEIIDGSLRTEYNGIQYRKRQDAVWASFFDFLKIPFEYSKEPIKIGEGMCFRPDFWMPAQDCFIIVDQHLLGSENGRMVALSFAKTNKKVLVQLHDCQPGIEYAGDKMVFHSGFYLTPEGDYDGSIEWGICAKCQVINLGYLGTASLCDSDFWLPAENKCGCLVTGTINPFLKLAYKAANSNIK